jgi:hypothetical protein
MLESPAEKLRAARIKAGYTSAADACRAFGWSDNYSTYVHHENGTRGSRGIPKEWALRYVAAFKKTGLSLSDLLGLKDDVEASIGLVIDGAVEMGVWREQTLDGQERNTRKLKVPPSKTKGERRALQVLDDSVNQAIAPGEYAIYRPLSEPHDLDALVGQLLFVECVIRKMVERSIRIASMAKDGRLRLTAHSTNHKYDSAMMYPCAQGNVTILGCVVGKYADWPDGYPQKK